MVNHFRLVILLLLLQFHHTSSGQSSNSAFFKIIKDDSVMMFFNDRHFFIERKCADFIRYTTVDNEGYFNGYFEDYSIENILISKGYYVHGQKHGYFEIYYPNGKIKCKGNYVNNMPAGQWEYFYENEFPERTINITESDTLLMRFMDRKGNLKVIDGNGEFNGVVAGNSRAANSIIAKGKIENGKPHGKWTSTLMNNTIYCKEEFNHGKLVRGVFPNAMLGGNQRYTDRSFLNTFFLDSYLTPLEDFRLEQCSDSAVYTSRKYSFDIHKFNSDLRLKIDRVIENDLRAGRVHDYSIGDNYLTIQFFINKDGKARDFQLLTPWGQQFFDTISTSIGMQTKFPPPVKTMYFHLRLQFPGGSSFLYNFQFSSNRTID